MLAAVVVGGAATATRRRALTLKGAGSTFVSPLVSTLAPALRVGDRRPCRLQPDRLGRRDPGDPEPHGRLRRERRAADARPVQRRATAASRSRGRCPATSIAYNLPGAPPHLKITGPVLANIFLGNVKKWNDAGDQEAQPGRQPARHDDHADLPLGRQRDDVQLHGLPVERQPCVQVEGRRRHAGQLPGRRRRPRLVRRLGRPLADERRDHLRRRRVRAGEPLQLLLGEEQGRASTSCPARAQIKAAVATVKRVPADNKLSIVNPPKSAPAAYPICTFTYVILPLKTRERGAAPEVRLLGDDERREEVRRRSSSSSRSRRSSSSAAEKTLKKVQSLTRLFRTGPRDSPWDLAVQNRACTGQ